VLYLLACLGAQIDLVQGMMDCLYATCIPCITDCVLAELEKLGQKYRVALKVAKARILPPAEPCLLHSADSSRTACAKAVVEHQCLDVVLLLLVERNGLQVPCTVDAHSLQCLRRIHVSSGSRVRTRAHMQMTASASEYGSTSATSWQRAIATSGGAYARWVAAVQYIGRQYIGCHVMAYYSAQRHVALPRRCPESPSCIWRPANSLLNGCQKPRWVARHASEGARSQRLIGMYFRV